MKKVKRNYPFTAIVGQEKMKKALILNIINPSIGGVLIRGEKGTAKSTAVRGLVDLLPEIEQVEGCPFGCNPLDLERMCDTCRDKITKGAGHKSILSPMRVIDLPISATEDRVVGTLDIEYAIKNGKKKLEPGILAQANRNVLYIDEVNLLEDHVVDVLLDSAAMGINTVEREGISFSHPAKFIIVGTMNPEEGDLRPQLLDRFGLMVNVVGEKDIALRTEVIKRRLAYEKNPTDFIALYEEEQKELSNQILKAKGLLINVKYEDEILETIARMTIEMGVDGHRADIGILKTAITIAAYHLREFVLKEDLLEAAELALPHRMRRQPFEEGNLDIEKLKEIMEMNDSVDEKKNKNN